MTKGRRYEISCILRAFLVEASGSLGEVLSTAGIANDRARSDELFVSRDELLRLWQLVTERCDDAAIVRMLRRAASSSQGSHPYMALSASATVHDGLLQYGRMKIDLAPARLVMAHDDAGLWLGFEATDPESPLPVLFEVMMLAYLLELLRHATAADLVPVAVALPTRVCTPSVWSEFFGRAVVASPGARMLLSRDMLRMPHASASSAVLAYVTERHARRFRTRCVRSSTSAKVLRVALRQGPRAFGVADAAAELGLTVADLESRVQEEGETVRALLIEAHAESTWGMVDAQVPMAPPSECEDAELRARVARARQIVHASITSPPTFDRLAAEVGLAPRRMEQAFLASYGDTVRRCVLRWRLEYARARLLNGSFSIKEVALELGYGDPANFTRAYRRLFGEPPSSVLQGKNRRSAGEV